MMKARREGFTLVELLVVVVIGTVVLGAVYRTVAVQEAANRQQLATATTAQNMRVALAVLTNDLREVSATGGDVLEATSTSIRFRSMRKAGIICTKDYGGSAAWAVVVAYGDTFAIADSIMLFRDGPNRTSSEDDSWAPARVSSTQTTTSCLGHSVGNRRRINFPNGTVAAADSGGLVRSFAHVGYRLVSTSTGGTLFRIEKSATSTGGAWPLSVPATDSVAVVESLAGGGGLALRYYDADGTQLNPATAALRAAIMRIEVKVSASAIGGASGARRVFTDSLVSQVYLRGNDKPL
jgi:prepilin-type N-terminal cleavage/methylation domain-containing protein